MALDLNVSQLDDYWNNKDRDGRLYNILKLMNSVESWTLDENELVHEELNKMTIILEKKMSIKKELEENKKDLLFVMAYISSSKAIRLFEWFDKNKKYQDLADSLIEYSNKNKDDPICGIFLERLIIFKRASMLYKIFSADRIKKISEFLD